MITKMLAPEKIFECELKSRSEMERTISMDQLSWWHDCLPGSIVKLRQATPEDLKKCWIRKEASKDPANYMIELIENGRLILKKAIKSFKEVT